MEMCHIDVYFIHLCMYGCECYEFQFSVCLSGFMFVDYFVLNCSTYPHVLFFVTVYFIIIIDVAFVVVIFLLLLWHNKIIIIASILCVLNLI